MKPFRTITTSSGVLALLGKSAETNEQLIRQVKPTDTVLHTHAPGSPFCVLSGAVTKQDIKEAAIFTAKYSQEWRDTKRDIVVDIFRGCDMYKDKKMKLGTFGVRHAISITVTKSDILNFEKILETSKPL